MGPRHEGLAIAAQGQVPAGWMMRKKYRDTPPPLTFDIWQLPASGVLSAREVAAVLRCNLARLEHWRLHQPDHPLKWRRVGGRPVYEVGSLREFIGTQPG